MDALTAAEGVQPAVNPTWTPSQRSLLAEVEAQAAWYAAPLAVNVVPPISGQWFSYERRWRGLRTGLRDGVVLLDRPADADALRQAAAALVQAHRGDMSTFRVALDGAFNGPTGRTTTYLSRAVVTISPSLVREVLSLPEDPAGFAAALGRGSRRNIERCRRRTDQRGMRYRWSRETDNPDLAELEELCRNNMPTGLSLARVASMMAFTRGRCQPFLAELRDHDGALVSMAGGFVEGDVALMMFQINHRRYRDIGPSLAIRAFIAEKLIPAGVRHLAFVGKCAGILRHSCARVPMIEMLVVRRSPAARIKQLACVLVEPRSRIGRLSLDRVGDPAGEHEPAA